jgi:hypothetical protein
MLLLRFLSLRNVACLHLRFPDACEAVVLPYSTGTIPQKYTPLCGSHSSIVLVSVPRFGSSKKTNSVEASHTRLLLHWANRRSHILPVTAACFYSRVVLVDFRCRGLSAETAVALKYAGNAEHLGLQREMLD